MSIDDTLVEKRTEVLYTVYLEVYSILCTWKSTVYCVPGSEQYTVYLEVYSILCTWKCTLSTLYIWKCTVYCV